MSKKQIRNKSSKQLAKKVTQGFLKHKPNSGNPSKSTYSTGGK